MLYSIILTERGVKAGFSLLAHATYDDGRVMVVNENELRTLDGDIHTAAAKLGGKVMTHSEVINTLKTYES